MGTLDPWYLERLVCPVDRTALEYDGQALISKAGRRYPVVDGLPVMLLPDEEQTMGIARASIERAHGHTEVIDQRAPAYYLETLGISEAEKARLVELVEKRLGRLDPVQVGEEHEVFPGREVVVEVLGLADDAESAPDLEGVGLPPREERQNSYIWFVESPRGKIFKLPLDANRDQLPRCYVFLPATKERPVRLAVAGAS